MICLYDDRDGSRWVLFVCFWILFGLIMVEGIFHNDFVGFDVLIRLLRDASRCVFWTTRAMGVVDGGRNNGRVSQVR